MNFHPNMSTPVQAKLGDLIESPNSPGFAVLINIGPPKYCSAKYSITYKRICDRYWKTFKSATERTMDVNSLPIKINRGYFDNIKETIRLLEGYT